MSGQAERSNEEWVERLAGADDLARAAQKDLARMLRNALARALGERVDSATLDDFVQDAVIRVIEKLPQFRGESRFTTWAVTIAMRIAFTELRKARWRDVDLEPLDTHGAAPGGEAAFAEESLDRRAIERVMVRVIDSALTPRQRQALLAKVDGMPSAVLCERLGTNPNALYKLVHDARRAVRRGMIQAGVSTDALRSAFDV